MTNLERAERWWRLPATGTAREDVESVAALLDEAEARGAERMREAAIAAADPGCVTTCMHVDHQGAWAAMARIRALPTKAAP